MPAIHIDTDIGGDIDDLCALAMVLKWPSANLLAVTTVSDDAGKRAGYARYVLDLAGRSDIPVAAGADIALGRYTPIPGFPDEAAYWPEPVPPYPTPLDEALTLLEGSIEQGAVIAAIGPYTNLALLEEWSPGILRRARLVLMGGYIFPPRAGYPQWGADADWNVQVDAEAAHRVLRCSDPVLVPLTVTVETALRRAYLRELEQAGSIGGLIARQAEVFARDEGYEAALGQTCAALPDDTINFQHDALTCAVALGWSEGVELSEVPLTADLDDGSLRLRIDESGRPTRVVTRVDGGAFNATWLEMVVR